MMPDSRSVRSAWKAGSALLAASLSLFPLAGCSVVPIEEARRAREAQGGRFDAKAYVATLWSDKTIGELTARAVPIEQLRQGPIEAVGKTHGTRAGEGSGWTFVTQVSAVVNSVAIDQPRGAVTLSSAAGDIQLQAGPVVSGTAIRDAIPAVNFDDFPDQIAFAEVGQGLTDRAIARVRPVLSRLRPGDRVTVLGVTSLTEAGDPIVLTPLSVAIQGDAG